MRYNVDKIKADVNEITLEKEHKAAWNHFCENCGEPLEDDTSWVLSRHRDDDDPIEVQYCRKCIKIDRSRTRETRGPSARS